MSGGGWAARLKSGLRKSSVAVTGAINDIFVKRPLDAASIQALEDALIAADLGVDAAARLSQSIAKTVFDKDPDGGQVRAFLAAKIAEILAPVAIPFAPAGLNKPHVVLVCGVNGTGKTTTIGKLASRFQGEGRRVMLAAADTFRAAAVEQLQRWGERVGADVIAHSHGADPGAVAYDALESAVARGAGLVLIDTAGRLQIKKNLMAELAKVRRVIAGRVDGAPHESLLVLDANTGGNALSQGRLFGEAAAVSAVCLAKLDGSSKGGVVFAVAQELGLPVRFVGTGEGPEDLAPFDPAIFVDALLTSHEDT